MKSQFRSALAVASVLLLTACSSTTETGANSNADGGSAEGTVNYGSFSTGTGARQVLVAEDMGLFEDHGIDLEITTLMSTSALAQLVASGDADIANLTYQPAFNAMAAGVELRMLSGVQKLQDGMQTVYVKEDSGIESIEDLRGKKIAVASLGGYGESMVAEALETAGMTLDDVTMVEVSPPETTAAIQRGDVDAGHLTPPSRAAVEAEDGQGLEMLIDFNSIPSLEGMPQGALVTSADYYEGHEDLIGNFMDAVDEAAQALEEDPEQDTKYLAELGKFEPSIAENIVLETWVGGETTREDLQRVVDLMVEHGQLQEGSVDLDQFMGGEDAL
ncbi:ABC transporter substrate-binding protein [Citricoccus sp. GCM10030269]|uniref:ABC transporter substrate-binding protein n=1 Tax=Citricoccus sp. GCM10030269 TaxID=3273388 RepID=UPI00360AF156